MSAFDVPPVERISTPYFESAVANSTRPVLSDTDIRARLIFTGAEAVMGASLGCGFVIGEVIDK